MNTASIVVIFFVVYIKMVFSNQVIGKLSCSLFYLFLFHSSNVL